MEVETFLTYLGKNHAARDCRFLESLSTPGLKISGNLQCFASPHHEIFMSRWKMPLLQLAALLLILPL